MKIIKKRVNVRLLSNVLISSGQTENALVDIDSIYDDFGLPWIPGKRILGILKERAEEMKHVGLINGQDLEYLFGVSGEQEGALSVGNAYIPNYESEKEVLEKELNKKGGFTREEVIDLFTSMRNQTSIQDGVAKDHSLRFIRVYDHHKFNKNLGEEIHFQFDISLSINGDQNVDQEILTNLVYSLISIGSHRNRGLGNITCVIDSKEEQINEKSNNEKMLILERKNDENTKDTALWEMDYQIEAYEPIVNSHLSGKQELCEEYIHGTQIRGIVAYRLLTAKREEITSDIKDAIINDTGSVIFHNTVPLTNQGALKPMPVSVVKDKYNKQKFVDFSKAGDEEKSEGIITKKCKSWWNGSTDQELIMDLHTHHRRNPDRSVGSANKEGGELFSYTALPKGQKFTGKVEGPHHLLKEIVNSFNEEPFCSVGKSKKSQYGKAKIEVEKIKKKEIESENCENTFKVILTSPMLVMNERGSVGPDLPYVINTLEENFSKKGLIYQQGYLKYRDIGGYNGMWGLPKGKVTALDIGSLLVFHTKEAIDFEEFRNFVQKRCCTRGIEGFNQMEIYGNIESYYSTRNREDNHGKSDPRKDKSTDSAYTQSYSSIVKGLSMNRERKLELQVFYDKGRTKGKDIHKLLGKSGKNFIRSYFSQTLKSGLQPLESENKNKTKIIQDIQKELEKKKDSPDVAMDKEIIIAYFEGLLSFLKKEERYNA